MTHYTTSSEAETHALGQRLARRLPPGSVVLLRGDLGAGKTALVRGLAVGLGIDPDGISSPTFTLVHEYRGGRLPLFHADLYRLPPGAAIEDLGLDELAETGILAIEWPERLARPVAGAVGVTIEIGAGDVRTITIADGAPG